MDFITVSQYADMHGLSERTVRSWCNAGKMQGGFTVTVMDTDGATMGIKTTKPQTITRSNLLKMPALTYEGTAPAPEHQYVDLGLPSGLKWATCNVGATVPEEYGDYFAWGETQPYYSSQDPLTWKSDKTGFYWSSSLTTGYPLNAWRVYFDSDDVYRDDSNRSFGHSVRPVTE